MVLGDLMDNEEMSLLEELGLAYLLGDLPYWFYCIWLSTQTVGLFKSAARDDARPLGIRNSLMRLFNKEVVVQSRQEIRSFLEPQQLGFSQAGAAKLVHCVRGILSHRRDFICVRMDLRKAFNGISW